MFMRVVMLALCVAVFVSVAVCQPGPFSPLLFVQTSPSGNACSNSSPLLYYVGNQTIYGCASGAYTSINSSSGNVTGSGLTNLSLIIGQGSSAIAAATGLTTDGSGAFTATGAITAGSGGGTGGRLTITQGTDQGSCAATSLCLDAPTSITAYRVKVPTSASEGFFRFDGTNTATWVPSLDTSGSVLRGTKSGNTTVYGSVAGSLTNGDCLKADSSGNIVDNGAACGSGGGGNTAGATLFSTTGSTTVTATTATTLIGTVSGSTTIPANTFTAGSVMEFLAEGYYTSTGLRTLTIDFRIGGTTQLTTGAVTAPGATNGVWRLHCGVTTRTAGSSGTQIGNCILELTGPTLTPGEAAMQTASTWAVDTTGTLAVDLKATWDSATGSPTITSTNIAAWIPGAPVTSVNGGTGAVNTTTSGLYGSAPVAASTNSGSLYLPTDSYYVLRSNGSANSLWGPIYPQYDPVNAQTYTTVGSPTVVTTNGAISITGTSSAGSAIDGKSFTLPSAPYTFTVALSPLLIPASFAGCGIFLSDGTKYATLTFYTTSTTPANLSVSKYTNRTTFSADYTTKNWSAGYQFFRFLDDNTNRIASVSWDGINFATVFSVGRTDFLTPTLGGIFCDSHNSSTTPSATFFSLKVTTP